MSCAIAIYEAFERNPLNFNTVAFEVFLQLFRLSGYSHDVTRSYSQIVVGIVQLVFYLDGDDGINSIYNLQMKH